MIQLESNASQKRRGTVLFADMVGFTQFAERAGAEAAFELIQIVSGQMKQAVLDHSGTIGEYRGDGIMALFSVTTALEDGPLSACRAALQIQTAMQALHDPMMQRHGVAPQVRIGVHSGTVVIGDVGDAEKGRVSIIGDTANVAARLESMAGQGQVFISSDLFALVQGRVVVTDLGTLDMKGKSEPQQVYLLQAVRDGVSRFGASVSLGLSTLTEREDEVAGLDAALSRALSGKISVANISGEAGIGKSRLLYEFEQGLPAPGVRILKGDCRSDGATIPFMPFAEMLRTAMSVDDTVSAADLEQRLTGMLGTLELETAANLPFLMALLGKTAKSDPGLSPDMVADRLRQVIVAVLSGLAARSTVVLIIEDLHWSDPSTVQIIDGLVRLPVDIPLLILCTSRPEFHAPWHDHVRVVGIVPKPLSGDGVTALIQGRLAGVADADAVARQVVEKADGNPLYAEEIVKLLVQRRQSGGASVAHDDSAVVLPTNLQNMVMERFDRLPADLRKLLQAAAVIGRRFDARLASRIVGPAAQFDPVQMDLATTAELVMPVSGTAGEFQFKHALVQDAVRDTLLRGQKRILHERIGHELEVRYADRLAEASESLAFHFSQAEIPGKAATYLIAAGGNNLRLFSLAVANDAFAQAFALIEQHQLDLDQDIMADLFANWFEVKQWLAEFGKMIALFESQPHRMAAISGNRRYANILGLVGTAYNQNLLFALGEQQFDKALAIGARDNDREAILHGCLGKMGHECFAPSPGFLERIAALVDRVNGLLGDEPNSYYRTYCDFYNFWSLAIHGDMDLSRRLGLEQVEKGRRTGYNADIGYGANAVAFNEAYNENYPLALTYATLGETAASGQVLRLVSLGLKGFAMVMNGDVAGGNRILDDIIVQQNQLEYRGVDNIVDGPKGLAIFLGGDMGGGVRWLQSVILRCRISGNTHGEAMAHISLGTLHYLLATGTEKPSLDLLRRNFWFLVKTLPFAKSRAATHFELAAGIGRRVGMRGVAAQALCGKGLALKAAKKTDAARVALTEAQQIMATIEWAMMRDRVDAALADLG